MTNEEKAKEIAKKNSSSYGFGLNYDSSVECYDSAMEMAQFMIDKAVERYRKEVGSVNALFKCFLGEEYDGVIDIERSVDEFKKAMEK